MKKSIYFYQKALIFIFLFIEKKYPEAKEACKLAEKTKDNNQTLNYHVMALIELSENNATKSLQLSDEALALDQSNSFSNYYKALVLIASNRINEANKCFDIAIKIDPFYPEFYDAKAILFLKIKDFKKSIELFDTAIKLKPLSSEYFFKKAYTLNKTHQYRMARLHNEIGQDLMIKKYSYEDSNSYDTIKYKNYENDLQPFDSEEIMSRMKKYLLGKLTDFKIKDQLKF